MNQTLSNRGFTLIELIMVIGIIALLGVVAIPFYADLRAEARGANELAVAGGVRSGVLTFFVDPAKGNRTTYPGSLDGASAAACSDSNACFSTVLTQGGVTSDWAKLSGTTYRSPVNSTNIWSYNSTTGAFTKTTT